MGHLGDAAASTTLPHTRRTGRSMSIVTVDSGSPGPVAVSSQRIEECVGLRFHAGGGGVDPRADRIVLVEERDGLVVAMYLLDEGELLAAPSGSAAVRQGEMAREDVSSPTRTATVRPSSGSRSSVIRAFFGSLIGRGCRFALVATSRLGERAPSSAIRLRGRREDGDDFFLGGRWAPRRRRCRLLPGPARFEPGDSFQPVEPLPRRVTQMRMPTEPPADSPGHEGQTDEVAASARLEPGPVHGVDPQPLQPEARETGFLPAEPSRRAPETVLVRLVATAGVIGIGTALGAILIANDVEGWITGLAVSAASVILAAVLWRSRRL
jgi:hypothetical protein